MADSNGAILGIVSEDGVVKVNNPVVLMDHNLQVLARTVTDANGGYAFYNLDPYKTDYMVFTVDNDGAEPKAALIKDYITPIQTVSGTLRGNFPALLDALAPAMSLVSMNNTGTNNSVAWNTQRMVRAAGCGMWNYTNDYGILSNWLTTNYPVPTNDRIIAANTVNNTCGWSIGPTAFYLYENRDLVLPKASAQAPLTMMVFDYRNGNAATYSVTYQLFGDLDTYIQGRIRYGFDGQFTPSTSSYFCRTPWFNLCFEADGSLKVKWLQSNGINPNRKTVTICPAGSLVTGKWYQVFLRYSGVTTEYLSVDIIDVAANTKKRYFKDSVTDVSAELNSTPLGTLHKGNEFGTVNGNNTTGPLRNGMIVSGAHNQATGAFNIWGSGYDWSAFTNATNATFGPMAFWNVKLSNQDIDDLQKAACDTVTTWRVAPRFVSEIMGNGVGFWWPNDEPPGSPQRNSAKAHRRVIRSCKNTNVTYFPVLTGRRRQVAMTGNGPLMESISFMSDRRWTFSFGVKRISSAAQVLFSLSYVQQGDHYSLGYNSTWIHNLYVNIDSNGKIRIMYRQSNDTYYDQTFTAAAAINVGDQKWITFVNDSYDGLTTRLYINGVQVGSFATTQLDTRCAANMNDWFPFWSRAGLMFNSSGYYGEGPNTVNQGWNTEGMSLKDRGVLVPSAMITDACFFNRMLNDADILEISNAYLLAVGPDAQV